MDRCETEPSEGRDSSDSDGPFNEQEQNMRTKRMTMRLRHTMTLQKLQSTDLFAVKKTEHPDRKRTGEPQRKTDVPNPAPFDPEAGPTEVKPHLKLLNFDFKLPPYGENWEKDIVLVYDNTIRAEFNDFHIILEELGSKLTRISYNEVEYLLLWFEVFSQYIVAFLDLDATIFFQYIAAKEEPPAEFKDRTQMQADINKRVEKLEDIIASESLSRQPPGMFIQTLAEFHDAVGSQLFRYFELKERLLPPIFLKHYTEKDKIKMERECQRKLRRESIRGESVGACQRWMDPKARQKWKKQALGFRSVVSFKVWVQKWEARHLSIADYFMNHDS